MKPKLRSALLIVGLAMTIGAVYWASRTESGGRRPAAAVAMTWASIPTAQTPSRTTSTAPWADQKLGEAPKTPSGSWTVATRPPRTLT